MTAFGKILVFMNLLFSVITGALIVFVFTARANWKTAYDDAKVKAEAASAAYVAERTAHENDLKQKDAGSEGLKAEVASLKNTASAYQAEADQARRQAATQANLVNDAKTAEAKVQAELAQITAERQGLVAEKNDLRLRIVNVQKELDEQRKQAIQFGLQSQTLLQKNTNLLRQLEDLTVKVRQLEQSGVAGTGGASDGRSVLDPPAKSAPPGVRGKVTVVGREGTSLAQVNVGSDSGLAPGNVLTVFRGTVYVGELTLTNTEAKAAVGKFTPAKRTLKIEEGDSVITSFANGQ